MKFVYWVVFVCIIIAVLVGSDAVVNAKKIKGNNNSKKLNINDITVTEASAIYEEVMTLQKSGKTMDAIVYLERLLNAYGTLALPYEQRPSLFSYYGLNLVQPGINRQDEAIIAFRNATIHTPDDIYSWLNMAEVSMQRFRLREAIDLFQQVLAMQTQNCTRYEQPEEFNECRYVAAVRTAPRMLRAMAWTANWQGYDFYSHVVEKAANDCYTIFAQAQYHPEGRNYSTIKSCRLDGSSGLEYTDLPGAKQLLFDSITVDSQLKPPVPPRPQRRIRTGHPNGDKLRVGILSSDFGVHPVSSLVRGLVQFLVAGGKIELFLFNSKHETSYWGINMTDMAGSDHFIYLTGQDTMTAARAIQGYDIDILIDLNGHTLGTGLPIMAHRPAPVQMTYLGLPTSTGASFIDYLIGDPVASPPEHALHFFERLTLLPLGNCYIANDFAQMLGDVLYVTGDNRAPRSVLELDDGTGVQSQAAEDEDDILIATLSSPLKLDPLTFDTWMNILRVAPRTKMMFITFQGSDGATNSLRRTARLRHGIWPRRLLESPLIPWINHIYTKTAIDLVLDTVVKNGHTTGLDALWAGLPMIGMGGGHVMAARASESMASAFGDDKASVDGIGVGMGLAFSLKEYEDIATTVLASAPNSHGRTSGSNRPWRLRLLRDYHERQRLLSNVFNTPQFARNFESLMQATWEVNTLTQDLAMTRDGVARSRTAATGEKKIYHIFSLSQRARDQQRQPQGRDHSIVFERKFAVDQVHDRSGPPVEWIPPQHVKDQYKARFGFDPSQPIPLSSSPAMPSTPNTHSVSQNSRSFSEMRQTQERNPSSKEAAAVRQYARAQSGYHFKHPDVCEDTPLLPITDPVILDKMSRATKARQKGKKRSQDENNREKGLMIYYGELVGVHF
jgi:predicted O-linked N-acetylglucosamine transferase (SPINDLY family)